MKNKQPTVHSQVASEIVGFENVVTDHPKSLGADDFADYLAVIPGIYGRVGSRNPENPATHFGHHHEQFDIDERALLLAKRVPRTLCIKLFIRIIGIGSRQNDCLWAPFVINQRGLLSCHTMIEYKHKKGDSHVFCFN